MSEYPTNFRPLAPLRVCKSNGTERTFGLGAASASALGTALMAAQTAAVGGDTIEVGPGTYTPSSASLLGKSQINWNFAPGATVQKSSGGATNRIWNDAAGPLTGVIGGHARLINASAMDGQGVCIELGHAETDVTIYAESIEATNNATTVTAVQLAAKVRLKVAKYIKSGLYDAVILGGGSGTIEADELIGGNFDAAMGGNGLEFVGGQWVVKARRILGGGDAALNTGTGDTSASLTVIGAEIRTAPAHANQPTIECFGSANQFHLYDCRVYGHNSINHTGVARFERCLFDSSTRNHPTITLTGNATTLVDCHLVMKSTETYALSASSAKTVYVVGSLTITDETGANRIAAVHPNITLVYLGRVEDATKLQGVTPTATGLATLAASNAAAGRNAIGATSGTFGASVLEGTSFSVYSAGEFISMGGGSYALVDFVTTDPAITITRPGTYLLLAAAMIVDDGGLGGGFVGFRLRRTNNTAANISNTTASINIPQSIDPTDYRVVLPPVIYTTANNDDIIQLWGNDFNSVGFLASTCSIVAIQLATGAP